MQSPNSPEIVAELITPGRLHSYASVFPHKDEVELMGAYLWNSYVCAQLYPIVQLVEVSLRNAIDSALTPAHNQMWWAGHRLHYASFRRGQTQEPPAVEKLRNNFRKAAQQVVSDKYARYGVRSQPTHAEIVAKAEFSTWEWVVDSEFYGSGLFWPGKLKRAFRGDWQGKNDSELLTHVRDQVRSIRMFRNRLFHHEPAWKKHGISNERDAVEHLQERVKQLSDFLGVLHLDLNFIAAESSLLASARRACSLTELHRFQQRARTRKMNTKHKLEKLVKECAQSDAIAVAKAYRSGLKFLVVPLSDPLAPRRGP